MNMEQKLAYLQKALEMGARIEVKFHFVQGEQKAKEMAATFSEMSGIPAKSSYSNGAFWYNVDDYKNQLETTVFYKPIFMEEDVDLSGGDEIAI